MSLLSTSAAVAVDTLHALYGDAAVLTPPSAAGVSVHIIMSAHDPIIDILGTTLRSEGFKGLVSQAELPTRPPAGSAVVVSQGAFAGSYAVDDIEEDDDRTQFLLWLVAA